MHLHHDVLILPMIKPMASLTESHIQCAESSVITTASSACSSVFCSTSCAYAFALHSFCLLWQTAALCAAAAMELVAMELKQSGSFIARTLSYEVV